MLATLPILIVDDHEAMRTLLCTVLERAGAGDVRVAASGEEALALLAEAPAGLVLADQTMPGMDGVALVAHLRADERMHGARIVMISGKNDAAHREEAAQAGVDAVLVKPVSPRALLETLERVLGA
jgi:two-component system chemotaxis response regulator CheY